MMMRVLLRPITEIIAADDTLLAGTSGFGIYRSTNLGASWTLAIPGAHVIDFAMLSDNVDFLGPNGALMRSVDGGASFQPPAADLPARNYGQLRRTRVCASDDVESGGYRPSIAISCLLQP